MKNPLHYQLSEYDCGPTSMLNAISFLFEREEIPPEVIRNIMLYSLDCYNSEGIQGKSGTSCAAMTFLTNWLNSLNKIGRLPVSAQHLTAEQVYLGDGSRLNHALACGGAVIVRLYFDEPHYILLTGQDGDNILAFDPYYVEKPFDFAPDIQLCPDHLKQYNRIVPSHYFNCEGTTIYALGPTAEREAVILYNTATRLTEEKTIEYFI